MRRFSVLFIITAVYFFLLNPAFAKDTGHVKDEMVGVKGCDEDNKNVYYPGKEIGSMGKWPDLLLDKKYSPRLQPGKTGDEEHPR